MTTAPTITPRQSPGRFTMLLGLALAILGIVAYVVQINVALVLVTPWYMPVLATLGAFLVIVSLWRKFTVWRLFALVLVILLAGLEWTTLLQLRLPAYTGPVAAGKTFPAFSTLRADGNPFTQSDLSGPQRTAMVFFRGRW